MQEAGPDREDGDQADQAADDAGQRQAGDFHGVLASSWLVSSRCAEMVTR